MQDLPQQRLAESQRQPLCEEEGLGQRYVSGLHIGTTWDAFSTTDAGTAEVNI